MGKKLLMGNEAFAHAALEAGVNVVAGYPGTPSSELVETVARLQNAGTAQGVHVEWSTNEKAALELCAGAAMSGAKALFTCKQVGLNVASDALMSLNYVGVGGALVLFVADDPGPVSSQTEQDTRRFASFAKVPVFDPATPEQGFDMMKAAFKLSEETGRPVIVRPTTRINHASTLFDVQNVTQAKPLSNDGFKHDPSRWVIFPNRAYQAHGEVNNMLRRVARQFSFDAPYADFNPIYEKGGKGDKKEIKPDANSDQAYGFGGAVGNRGKASANRAKGETAASTEDASYLGIITGGVSTQYAKEALEIIAREAAASEKPLPKYRFMQVGTPYPFPVRAARRFLEGLSHVLVLEELDSVIEEELLKVAGNSFLSAHVHGRLSGESPSAGENSTEECARSIAGFFDANMRTPDKPGLLDDARAKEAARKREQQIKARRRKKLEEEKAAAKAKAAAEAQTMAAQAQALAQVQAQAAQIIAQQMQGQFTQTHLPPSMHSNIQTLGAAQASQTGSILPQNMQHAAPKKDLLSKFNIRAYVRSDADYNPEGGSHSAMGTTGEIGNPDAIRQLAAARKQRERSERPLFSRSKNSNSRRPQPQQGKEPPAGSQKQQQNQAKSRLSRKSVHPRKTMGPKVGPRVGRSHEAPNQFQSFSQGRIQDHVGFETLRANQDAMRERMLRQEQLQRENALRREEDVRREEQLRMEEQARQAARKRAEEEFRRFEEEYSPKPEKPTQSRIQARIQMLNDAKAAKAKEEEAKRAEEEGEVPGAVVAGGRGIYGKKPDKLRQLADASFSELVESVFGNEATVEYPGDLPVRPPVLCAGCPHRGSFYAVKNALDRTGIRREDTVFCGDIGCYTLGNAAPLSVVDTCLCMGAGITMAQGMDVVEPGKKHVAFVGDSTFFASGLTGIVNAVYNQHDITICVLDNSTTAMTGSQPHPGTGKTLMGQQSEPVNIEKMLEAIGVNFIVEANPLNREQAESVSVAALEHSGPTAIIFRSACVWLKRFGVPAEIDTETCTGCKRCIADIGCPAILFDPNLRGPKSGQRGQAYVDPSQCNGCGLCVQVCPFDAIRVPTPIELVARDEITPGVLADAASDIASNISSTSGAGTRRSAGNDLGMLVEQVAAEALADDASAGTGMGAGVLSVSGIDADVAGGFIEDIGDNQPPSENKAEPAMTGRASGSSKFQYGMKQPRHRGVTGRVGALGSSYSYSGGQGSGGSGAYRGSTTGAGAGSDSQGSQGGFASAVQNAEEAALSERKRHQLEFERERQARRERDRQRRESQMAAELAEAGMDFQLQSAAEPEEAALAAGAAEAAGAENENAQKEARDNLYGGTFQITLDDEPDSNTSSSGSEIELDLITGESGL